MLKRSIWLLLILAFVLAGCAPQAAPAQKTVIPVPPTNTSAPAAAETPAAPAPAPTADTGASTSPLTSPVQPTSAVTTTDQTTTTQPAGNSRTLTVMTHDSFSASKDVIAKFEAQCGCKVVFLKSGDAGLALNKAILAKANPFADAFYGVDNTFLSRALAAGIFEPYDSPALAQIPAMDKLDPSNQLLPVDYGYVNLNYDRAYFAQHNLAVPQTLRDLTKPEYKGLLVVENPATSSPGMAFLLTTVAVFGETGSYTYLDYWKDLRTNDVLVVDGWDNAYNQRFSAGPGKGDRPLVVSYATSPAAEVYYADPQPAESPTGNILPPKESFRQVEFVGILKGAKNPDLAKEWVDFMLGPDFQADIPLQMWVYPTRTGTPLPEVFTKFAQVPNEPAALTPQQIDTGRDQWLQAWTDTVLR
jgi:thiamine transport system substrate-binding protein